MIKIHDKITGKSFSISTQEQLLNFPKLEYEEERGRGNFSQDVKIFCLKEAVSTEIKKICQLKAFSFLKQLIS